MHTAQPDTITVPAPATATAVAPAPAPAPTAAANPKKHSRKSFFEWMTAEDEPIAVKILLSPFRWFAAAVIAVGVFIGAAVAFAVIVPAAMVKMALML